MKKNNYLITGGAGFIGINFIKILTESMDFKYNKIIILDSLTYASDKSLLNKYLNDNIIFYMGDICQQDLVEELILKYDLNIVINFAAESHVDKSIKSQREFIHTNVLGVQSLLSACLNKWINDINLNDLSYKKDTRFIQISTDEVYGSSKIDDGYFDETSRLNPKNPYSASKASAEHMINAFINTYKFPAIIIRSTNNYGSGQNKEKLIPKAMDKVINDMDVALYVDGSQMRNCLYVEDNCHAILEIANRGEIAQVYNVVGNNLLTNKEIVNKIIKIYNENFNKAYKGRIKYVEDRLGHDFSYKVSGEKLKSELAISPKSNLDLELKKMLVHMRR